MYLTRAPGECVLHFSHAVNSKIVYRYIWGPKWKWVSSISVKKIYLKNNYLNFPAPNKTVKYHLLFRGQKAARLRTLSRSPKICLLANWPTFLHIWRPGIPASHPPTSTISEWTPDPPDAAIQQFHESSEKLCWVVVWGHNKLFCFPWLQEKLENGAKSNRQNVHSMCPVKECSNMSLW